MAERTSFLLILALWGAGLGAAGQYAKISVIFDQLPSVYPQAGATLGLVQGACFAAVPQLNQCAAQQAQAYGAMAQTGNLGNTLGTPILLAVLGGAGYAGLVWTVMALLWMGWAVHRAMQDRRS